MDAMNDKTPLRNNGDHKMCMFSFMFDVVTGVLVNWYFQKVFPAALKQQNNNTGNMSL